MEACDRKDAHELANLERCLDELRVIMSGASQGGAVIAPQSSAKRSCAAI